MQGKHRSSPSVKELLKTFYVINSLFMSTYVCRVWDKVYYLCFLTGLESEQTFQCLTTSWSMLNQTLKWFLHYFFHNCFIYDTFCDDKVKLFPRKSPPVEIQAYLF